MCLNFEQYLNKYIYVFTENHTFKGNLIAINNGLIKLENDCSGIFHYTIETRSIVAIMESIDK